MTASLDQAIPGPTHPLVDRDRKPTPVWYPWFAKIIDFINGVANGELIVDGAITANLIAAGAVTADAIAANAVVAGKIAAGAVTATTIATGAVTTEKLTATNIDVLDGTFGTLQTNAGTTRIQITDATNELRCYIGGTLVASIGANVITNGAFIACTSPSAAWYPAQFTNTSTSGGDLGTGGGALVCATVGGYAAQFTTSTTAAAAAINAANSGAGGGHGQVGRSASLGGWSFYDVDGSGYGPFTGAHDALIAQDERPEIGDILIDGAVISRSISDCLTVVRRSSAPNQPALGVFVRRHAGEALPASLRAESAMLAAADWEALTATYHMAIVNAVGEGAINVCGLGGNIRAGDLIVTSALPGKGMRQADDLIRAATVARAREGHVFSRETDVVQIACIYLSG